MAGTPGGVTWVREKFTIVRNRQTSPTPQEATESEDRRRGTAPRRAERIAVNTCPAGTSNVPATSWERRCHWGPGQRGGVSAHAAITQPTTETVRSRTESAVRSDGSGAGSRTRSDGARQLRPPSQAAAFPRMAGTPRERLSASRSDRGGQAASSSSVLSSNSAATSTLSSPAEGNRTTFGGMSWS